MQNFLFLASGFEEIEALATVDILRRANIRLTTVSITDTNEVTGAHGITVVADTVIDNCEFDDADWLILPGGMPGAENLINCKTLADALKHHHDKGGRIAAICASPGVVLAPLGIVEGKNAIAYPGFEERLVAGGAKVTAKRVVVDGNVITANGPSSAVPFALAIVEATVGKAMTDGVAAGMLC